MSITSASRSVELRGGEVPGRLRARGEDTGVHLHAGRDAEDRHAGADGVDDVAGRAVAARVEDQVDVPPLHLGGGGAGVVGRRLVAGAGLDELRREAVLACGVAAHRAGRRRRS